MKEIVFLNRNAERWKKFERILSKPSLGTPDTIAGLFVQITDDLAYARTYYPKSNTTRYLNTLALKAHQQIYRNRKEHSNRLVNFWRYEFPLVVRQSWRYLLYSGLIFLLAVLIGAVSAANDDSFVRLIMGDAYVNMTLENIENGDPMAVYKTANEVDMFLGISYNNIQVSFLAFVLGVFLSLGTVMVLFTNGIMLGSFQYFFFEHGYLYDSILSIWIHGTLEIWAIVVAGAAGIAMGNSILFPGTYSRLASFRRGVKQGVKLVVGLVPIFLTAGFLEGFVTRHSDSPQVIRWAIILASLAFIVWYFFIYPQKLYKQAQQRSEKKIND